MHNTLTRAVRYRISGNYAQYAATLSRMVKEMEDADETPAAIAERIKQAATDEPNLDDTEESLRNEIWTSFKLYCDLFGRYEGEELLGRLGAMAEAD